MPLQHSFLRHNALVAFSCGARIGTLGGLIGLGGAEFRLPLLIGLFSIWRFGGYHTQQSTEPRRLNRTPHRRCAVQ